MNYTEVLAGARDLSIGNLTANTSGRDQHFYNNATYHIATHPHGLSSTLQPLLNASHTRDRQSAPPDSNCHPGTRLEAIGNIATWADSTINSTNHVYWLYGCVGCGKSAIAQTVAEMLEEEKRLVGSFFFFRGSGERSRTTKLAVTLASQLAAAVPDTVPLIEAAVRDEPGLLTPHTSLSRQFRKLLFEPIFHIADKSRSYISFLSLSRRISVTKPLIIVIDGLDECEDQAKVEEFIVCMLHFFEQSPLIPLRFFITSRVEEHIRRHLSVASVRLDNLLDHSSLQDIELFIYATFKFAAEHNRVIKAYGEWPVEKDAKMLVKHTGGSFIFTTTLLKFILGPEANDGFTPMERLPLVLGINPGLDGLYSQTLSRSKDLPHFSNVIAAITLLFVPFSIVGLASLLGIKQYDVLRVLLNLQAIIQVPGDDRSPVTLYHTSLRDFLTDPNRSESLFVSATLHQYLADRCLAVRGQNTTLTYVYAEPSVSLAHDVYLYADLNVGSHWEKFWGAPHNFGELDRRLDSTIALLERRFPALFPFVWSTHAAMQCPEDPLPIKYRTSERFPTLIGYSTTRERDEDVNAIISILDSAVFAKGFEDLPTPGHRHQYLSDFWQCHERNLIKVSIYLLLAQKCASAFCKGTKFHPPRVDDSILLSLPIHIESAVRHDPSLKLEDLHAPVPGPYHCSCVRWPSHDSLQYRLTQLNRLKASVERAVGAIEMKFPGAFPTEDDQQGWHSTYEPSLIGMLRALRYIDPNKRDTWVELNFRGRMERQEFQVAVMGWHEERIMASQDAAKAEAPDDASALSTGSMTIHFQSTMTRGRDAIIATKVAIIRVGADVEV